MAVTAYLRQFGDEFKVLSEPDRVGPTSSAGNTGFDSSTSSAGLLVVFLWLAITVGRLVGLRLQRSLTLQRAYWQLMVFCVGGFAAALAWLVIKGSTGVLWAMVIVFGVFNGPALGYCYDLSGRISPNPGNAAAVAMFGVGAGASVVPVLVSWSWELTTSPYTLPLWLFVSHAIPLWLVLETRSKHRTGSRRPFGEDGSSVAAPTPSFGAPPSPTSGWSPAGSAFEEEDANDARVELEMMSD